MFHGRKHPWEPPHPWSYLSCLRFLLQTLPINRRQSLKVYFDFIFMFKSFFSYKMINNNECDKYEKLKIKTKDTKNYLKCERVRKEKKNSNILIFVSDKGTSIYRKPNNKTMCQEEILKNGYKICIWGRQPGDSRAAELRLKRQQEHANIPEHRQHVTGRGGARLCKDRCNGDY